MRDGAPLFSSRCRRSQSPTKLWSIECVKQTWHILSEDDIVDGIDELGVLLYGHAKNAYWYGSELSIEDTRKLAPHQNATGLQVTSAVFAGIVWMLENPNRGIVEDHPTALVTPVHSLVAIGRNGWSRSIGTPGRNQLELVVAISRYAQRIAVL